MPKTRLESFSDCVLSIIITIMVLNLKTPLTTDWQALTQLAPTIIPYILSFVFVGIYWNNHHHMFQLVRKINGAVLWANLHLLFWLSLIPWITGWLGLGQLATCPVVVYGSILLMSGVAYYILSHVMLKADGPDSALGKALGRDGKGKLSVLLYIIAVAAAFWEPKISVGIYIIVAAMWLIPDQRIEKVLME